MRHLPLWCVPCTTVVSPSLSAPPGRDYGQVVGKNEAPRGAPARRVSNLLPMGVAALVSVVTLSLLPHGWNVIAGALAGGIAGVIRER